MIILEVGDFGSVNQNRYYMNKTRKQADWPYNSKCNIYPVNDWLF